MLACFKIRAVPINVNHRYVAGELRYLLANSDSVGVIHAPDHGDVVEAVLGDLPGVAWTLSTGDRYDAALAAASADRPPRGERGEDDSYVIYTGGTPGLHKEIGTAYWRDKVCQYG